MVPIGALGTFPSFPFATTVLRARLQMLAMWLKPWGNRARLFPGIQFYFSASLVPHPNLSMAARISGCIHPEAVQKKPLISRFPGF